MHSKFATQLGTKDSETSICSQRFLCGVYSWGHTLTQSVKVTSGYKLNERGESGKRERENSAKWVSGEGSSGGVPGKHIPWASSPVQ